jgi:hypothetical protein
VRSIRRTEPRQAKGAKLYLQPSELARKLVKEMEDHKVSRSAHVTVCNRYTVFLCPEDYDRFGDHEDELTAKLGNHLFKHARAGGYVLPGEITVVMVADPDLKLGHFGILAEREAPGLADGDMPAAAEHARSARTGPQAAGQAEPADARPATAARTEPAPAGRRRAARHELVSGSTEIISPADASDMDLARQTIVVKAGNRVREYSQGRVIVGRAENADFRVDNPNVSRRHAVIYWVDGNAVIQDLGSTNGTMVNGHPVSSAIVRSGDVVLIGDCRFTVETR